MIVNKGNLRIELEEDIIELKEQIEQLEKLREVILNSPVYQLLDGKTQMTDKKTEVEIRSRLDHTINVANIAKQIASKLYNFDRVSNTEIFRLNQKKAELEAEITALAHDLGHTPFGHNGEAVVNEFMQSIEDKDVINKIVSKRIKYFGIEYEEEQGHTEGFGGKLSFEHNEQSAIEFCKIIEQNSNEFDKINTKRIVTGILSHSISRVPEVPDDLIAQIVRQTDKIEYRNKDYDEVMRYIKLDEDEELRRYQELSSDERIAQIIDDIANEAIIKGKIDDDNDSLKKSKKLRNKYENVVYLLDTDGKRGLLSGDNRERQQMIYKKLLEYYYQHPNEIPAKSLMYTSPINTEKDNKRVLAYNATMEKEDTLIERVISYLNTFTNEKCYKTYIRLAKQRALKGPEFGIEPITEEEIEERKRIQIEEQVAKMRAKDMYKGRETHTYQEYISILQAKNRRFIENCITDEAREVIEINRKKHRQENEEDAKILLNIKEADSKRLDLEKVKEKMRQAFTSIEDEEEHNL